MAVGISAFEIGRTEGVTRRVHDIDGALYYAHPLYALRSEMAYAKKIILHAPPCDSPALAEFVEACIRDGVVLVCVVGHDCERVEDVIDDLVVGDGKDPNRFLTTTSHADESLEDVRAFADVWIVDADPAASVQEVKLSA